MIERKYTGESFFILHLILFPTDVDIKRARKFQIKQILLGTFMSILYNRLIDERMVITQKVEKQYMKWLAALAIYNIKRQFFHCIFSYHKSCCNFYRVDTFLRDILLLYKMMIHSSPMALAKGYYPNNRTTKRTHEITPSKTDQ
jgi:hypothetical protein